MSMTRCLVCLTVGAFVGVSVVAVVGAALIEFTDIVEKDFRHA